MVFRSEKWRSSGGFIDQIEGGLYSEFRHSDPDFGRRRLILQSSSCRVRVEKLIPGGENGRRGREVESDANWVPSYAAEAGNEVEEDEEEEKEAADEGIGVRRIIGKGKEKVDDEVQEVEAVADFSDYEQMESNGDYKPIGNGAADEDEIPDEGTSQYAQRRTRKRRIESNDVDGLERFGGFEENPLYSNHISFRDHEVEDNKDNKESGTAGRNRSTGRKKRKFRKERKGHVVEVEGQDAQWAKSLRGPQLRLMQALKELGTERVNTIKEDSLYNCLTPAALRAIGIILEEHVKEQLTLLGSDASCCGEGKVQYGDSSSAGEEESPDSERRVDDFDDVGTDHEVKTDRMSTKKATSATRSPQNLEITNSREVSETDLVRRDEAKQTNTKSRKSSSNSSQAVHRVNDSGEAEGLDDWEGEQRVETKKSTSKNSTSSKLESPATRTVYGIQDGDDVDAETERRKEDDQRSPKKGRSCEQGYERVQSVEGDTFFMTTEQRTEDYQLSSKKSKSSKKMSQAVRSSRGA